MSGAEADCWGFFNRLCAPEELQGEALKLAQRLADGPNFAHGMTKTMLNQEWDMGLDAAIEAEAEVQAMCMQTKDFLRAYEAFVAKRNPIFEGN
jgi:enoyl-CoA hydratase/carnithine racemase